MSKARLPSILAARQCALLTLALPSMRLDLGDRRAAVLARAVWLAGSHHGAAAGPHPTPKSRQSAVSPGPPPLSE